MTVRIDLRSPHPLFDAIAAQQAEKTALAGCPPFELMQRAGAAVARLAAALAPHARHVWIACGPGNNGGDGLEAAVQLHRAGRPVCISLGADADRMPPDARQALQRARDAGVAFVPGPPAQLDANDLCIDALLGLGTSERDPPPWLQAQLQALHRAPCPVLAVDLPTGLQAGTGQYARGCAPEQAPRSPRHTLSLLTLKAGLFTAQGRDAAGTVWFDDLGVDRSRLEPTPPSAWLNGAPETALRAHASHKGSFGDVSVLGGEPLHRRGMGMGGAALLAASAALHGGAGRVLVALLDDEDRLPVDTAQPELMMRTPAALDLRRGAVVCGCGGGEAIAAHLQRVLAEAARLVLDADALNAIAADPALQELLRGRADHAPGTVLTPHPLEAARLLSTDAASVQADRLAAARQLADRYRCVVVLKGSGTVIAAPGTTPAVNPTGNGRLATAGTGDVLAGMIGARLAAVAPDAPLSQDQAFTAACHSVYAHGALADAWPPGVPLTAGGLARRGAPNQP